MAPLSDEDHIVFLLSCLRNSAGPVDFNKVAQECSIVSVGAASKRLSRLSQKYQNGVVGGGDTGSNEEGGVKLKDFGDNEVSPSKKTPKKENRSGKGAVKIEKSSSKDVTAPRAVGVGKKRSPVKSKANATAAFTPAVEGTDLKTDDGDHGYGDDDADAEFVPGFFNEEIFRGMVGGEHDDTD
ncbi:conserved hypothetical protein [Talaromyces stipitatus ATCC 10500]|uniref:Myb-like DNA-binding domain-containing protein n=1 Tax=Talaromyces stipitatus (strain ATCC 10500 / CBS 375.48 / QM 6759 / NRRL 1006) TaxID=441959 RepID=B8LZA4_TALSN|nr:uncharacterized protein TSTA_088930 [Talaromyces stipitatus ATCC 10500]EED21657.1 conserved hypothetical protein [Talaromyces stipitatus ATCC 10500]